MEQSYNRIDVPQGLLPRRPTEPDDPCARSAYGLFFLHPMPLLTDQIIVTTFNKFQNYSVIQIFIEKGEYYA